MALAEKDYKKSLNNSGNLIKKDHSCLICGDFAIGRHYGVFSCDGCGLFFGATMRRQLVYRCIGRNCEINKLSRKQCRYCRLQKCFTSGMKISSFREKWRPFVKQLAFPQTQANSSNTSTNTECHQENELSDLQESIVIPARPNVSELVDILFNRALRLASDTYREFLIEKRKRNQEPK